MSSSLFTKSSLPEAASLSVSAKIVSLSVYQILERSSEVLPTSPPLIMSAVGVMFHAIILYSFCIQCIFLTKEAKEQPCTPHLLTADLNTAFADI